MNSTYDVDEVKAIVSALCDWMHGQEIKQGLGVVAMLKLAGVVVGDRAKNEEDLAEAIEAMSRIFVSAAALSFTYKDKPDGK